MYFLAFSRFLQDKKDEDSSSKKLKTGQSEEVMVKCQAITQDVFCMDISPIASSLFCVLCFCPTASAMYTHFDDPFTLKDLQRGYNDERSSVSAAQTERKVDAAAAAAAAAAHHNKIKSIQTQLQAKFVDTAANPAPPAGLRRQVQYRQPCEGLLEECRKISGVVGQGIMHGIKGCV